MRNRSLSRGDRGAVLVIVAVFSLVAVLMLAFVVDLGNQRGEVKQVTLSTDAAALAAASTVDFRDPQIVAGSTVECSLVDSSDSRFATVQAAATHYWQSNGGSGAPGCTVNVHPTSRRTAFVTVSAGKSVEYALSGVTGVNEGNVSGSSSALVSEGGGGHLYPVQMCGADATTALANPALFDENGKSVNPNGWTDDVVFVNAGCGGAGNFRQVNFIPGTGDECGGAGRWCYDFKNGGYAPASYPAQMVMASDTGTNWNRGEDDGILPLVANGTRIWIVAGEYLYGSGSGARYEVTHFVEVRIAEYSRNRGMTFQVYQIVPYTTDGPPAMTNESPVNAHLCATGQGTSACSFTATPPPGDGSGVIDLTDPCRLTSVAARSPLPERTGATLSSDLQVDVSATGGAVCDGVAVTVRITNPASEARSSTCTMNGGTGTCSVSFSRDSTTSGPQGNRFSWTGGAYGLSASSPAAGTVTGSFTLPTCQLTAVAARSPLPTRTGETLSSALQVDVTASGGSACSGIAVTVDVSNPSGRTRTASCTLNAGAGSCGVSFERTSDNGNSPNRFAWTAGRYDLSATAQGLSSLTGQFQLG